MSTNYNQGNIIKVNLNPTKGYEQQNERPCLIVSHNLIYNTAGIVIIAPISNTKRNYPFYFKIDELSGSYTTKGKIMLDQLRAIDPNNRGAAFVEKLDNKDMEEILKVTKLIFDLNV